MYRDNYINSLRTELIEMVSDLISPVAMRYGYSEVPLETNIKWRPMVLVLGNYSSGKSTLINEFLGGPVQTTGQAPTDDSFTIITYDENVPESEPAKVTERRDGKYLLNDPEYPFELLKKHGQRFASHFQLKKVNAAFLRNLAIIDTPGMLDSITERDRGYNYQEVVGDFAQLADLVLVMFDPHKAGTVREAHTSLRDILPSRTFEDRVLFVLNRIDECSSLIDLLRVYGTLCWNLSQITGRKDIPMIHLTYSSNAVPVSFEGPDCDSGYLRHLDNQREELKKAIGEAPKHRLDNLASFVETTSERLSHLLEALVSYRKRLRTFRVKYFFVGLFLSLLFGAAASALVMFTQLLPGADPLLLSSLGGSAALLFLLLWMTILLKSFSARFHRQQLKDLDDLTPLSNQTRRDSWESIKSYVADFLKRTEGHFPLWEVNRDHRVVHQIFSKGTKEIREAMAELSDLKPVDIEHVETTENDERSGD